MTFTQREYKALHDAIAADLAALAGVEDLSFDALAEMTMPELVSYLSDHGVELDLEKLWAEIKLHFGSDLDAIDRGDHLDDSRMEALESAVQRAMTTAARVTAKASMRSMRQQLLDDNDDRPSSERLYIWVAKMRRPCRSCVVRHGEVKALDAWDDIGKPGDGSTLCKLDCECSLIPWPGEHADTRSRVEGLPAGG